MSTVGRDEAVVRECIANWEQEDKRLDQMGLWQEATVKVVRKGGAASATPISRFERLTF